MEQFNELSEILNNKEFINDCEKKIDKCVYMIINMYHNKGKLLLCGNGGSASQASHIAAEFVNRYTKYNDKRIIPAISLCSDSSVITSIANDSNFDNIFIRQIHALSNEKDIAWVFTTSGKSQNIHGILTTINVNKSIIFNGKNRFLYTEEHPNIIEFNVPSNTTARIQEIHLLLAHIICEKVEKALL